MVFVSYSVSTVCCVANMYSSGRLPDKKISEIENLKPYYLVCIFSKF